MDERGALQYLARTMTGLYFSIATLAQPASRGRMADVRVQAGVTMSPNPRGPS